MSVCCLAMLLSLLSGLYRVHRLRVSSLSPVAHRHYLPPLSFQKVLLFSLSFPLLFHHASFLFLSLAYWSFRTRLLACLIRAAILYFSCPLHLFTSWCFVIGSLDQHFCFISLQPLFFQMETGLVRGQFRVRYGQFGFPSVCRWHSYICFCALMSSLFKSRTSLFLQRKMCHT